MKKYMTCLMEMMKMKNEYLIRYIDYYNDITCEDIVIASSKERALDKFKKGGAKYWRIIEVILIKENVK